jgi:CutA1 divalent ion tolerance protein
MASVVMLTRVGSALVAAGAIAGGLLMRRMSTAPTYSACFITSPSTTHAQALARQLVQNQLAACVNILPSVQSVYSWKGEVQSVRAQHMLFFCFMYILDPRRSAHLSLALRCCCLHDDGARAQDEEVLMMCKTR